MLLGVLTGAFTHIPLVSREIGYAAVAALLDAVEIDPLLLGFPAVFYVVMAVGFDDLVPTFLQRVLPGLLHGDAAPTGRRRRRVGNPNSARLSIRR